MPATEWLNKYESVKDKLACKADLETYFTEKMIGNMAVDVLDIGPVHFPTGTIFRLRSDGGAGGCPAVPSDHPCRNLPIKYRGAQ